MPDIKEIARVAIDAYHGNVKKYSVAESQDTLRKALIDLNGGSSTLNYKAIRDGKCVGLFSLIEEILSVTIIEELQANDFFNSLVDFRNVKLGDKNIFEIEDSDLFTVADAAEGTQGIRRQRIGGVSQMSIPTTFKVVRIYEEMNRVLSGAIDFNTMINKVAQSFERKLLNDIWNLWYKAGASDFGGTAYFPVAGAYDEETLLTTIEHVEAAAGGKTATLLGTSKALRKIKPSIDAIDERNEIYHNGYAGTFYGNPVVKTPQRHKIGSTAFVFPEDTITILAGDDKPIKCVYEGDSIVIQREPQDNMDLTYEYLFGEKYGMAIVLAGGNAGIGRYQFT